MNSLNQYNGSWLVARGSWLVARGSWLVRNFVSVNFPANFFNKNNYSNFAFMASVPLLGGVCV